MKFDIQDIDNNKLSIETDDWDQAVHKFFELYPNTRLGKVSSVIEGQENWPFRIFRSKNSADMSEDEFSAAIELLNTYKDN